jgi:hypothetical protein
MWPSIVGTAVTAALVGLLIGLFGYFLGFANDALKTVGFWGGSAMSIIWSYIAVWMALGKRYRGFTLVPVENRIS